MPTSAFTFFNCFSADLATKKHDLNADTLKVYLTNATPDVAADLVKADLAEISTGNGYSGPIDVLNGTSSSGAGTDVGATDITITASGGNIGPLQHVVLFNDTTATKLLIGFWSYPSAFTLLTGEPFDIDFDPAILGVTP